MRWELLIGALCLPVVLLGAAAEFRSTWRGR